MASVSKIVLFALGLVGSVAASRHSTPKVSVKNGTYSGIYSAEYDQEFFLGMPYAQVGYIKTSKESSD